MEPSLWVQKTHVGSNRGAKTIAINRDIDPTWRTAISLAIWSGTLSNRDEPEASLCATARRQEAAAAAVWVGPLRA